MKATTWFYSQSFHDLPAPLERRPPRPMYGRSTCPRCGHLLGDEHCPCQLAANEVANRSLDPVGCLRGLDDDQCNLRCCAVCDNGDCLDGEEMCAACLTDLETERHANDELDARDRRRPSLDDRTPTDLSYDAWKARER